jgi:aldehyde dehydrogenase (NAD+)
MAKGIEAGTVWVNCYNVIDPSVGFGGWKMSGYGWKGGKELIDAHLVQKAVYLNVG